MNKFQSLSLMNRLGQSQTPFFFIIDFEMQNNIVFQLQTIDNNKLKFHFPAFFNSYQQNRKIDFEFTYKKIPFKKYQKSYEIVQKHIKAGNTYLCNLTASVELQTDLSLQQIFFLSNAKYKVLLDNEFVCFSPETFVQIKENKIFSYPMKGTIDAEIDNAEQIILANDKEIAEHYTIVDLIRNDLNIVSKNVSVEKFRYVDKIFTNNKTLLQVSSVISGILPQNYNKMLGDIIYSLLPAGSISGAPKKKTIEIINESENHNRGFYTGIAGYFDGKNLDSCVLIRFIEKKNGKFYYKAGGGITYLSSIDDEYNELHNKVYIPY